MQLETPKERRIEFEQAYLSDYLLRRCDVCCFALLDESFAPFQVVIKITLG